MSRKYFITGIDTDTGKTYITGLMLKYLKNQGISAITQKPVQTGDQGLSEDIEAHYATAGLELPGKELQKLQNPYIFKLPASPHLSSRLEEQEINPEICAQAADRLGEQFEVVLIEGAGGLMVPLTEKILTCDFVRSIGVPAVLVTSPKLGSINHTLMSLYILKNYGIPLKALIYNKYCDYDEQIAEDSLNLFKKKAAEMFENVDIIVIEKNQTFAEFDFLLK